MSSSFHVGLVSMPWPAFNRPSLQLGSLGAYLRQHEIQVSLFHPYLEVAHLLGEETYQWIAAEMWLCEALYAALLYPENYEDVKRLALQQVPAEHKVGFDFDAMTRLLDGHLQEWVDSKKLDGLDLLGFSICLNQLLASLCAVKYLRKKHPELSIVLGGSSAHPDAAKVLVDECGADYVVWGEGEQSLLGLCKHLRHGDALPDTVYGPVGWGVNRLGQLPDLALLPMPDYSDYMLEVEHVFGRMFTPVLPLEFSRGCWWGKCVFCNLNLQWQGYRYKKATQVQHEVEVMTSRYRSLDFTFTDNVLPVKESQDFFEWSRGENKDLQFFAEIRGNQRGAELLHMRRGGLTHVQVGIESLSSSLLKRMNKGMSVIENMAMMRDGVGCYVAIAGNLIVDFPSSTDDEVRETLENLDFVLPFRPLSTASFFLGLDSYIDRHPKAFGIIARTPHPKNQVLFPKEVLMAFPQIIQHYRGDRGLQQKRWAKVVKKVAAWKRFHESRGKDLFASPVLSFRDGGDFILIRQEQINGKTLHHTLKGMSRLLFLYVMKIRTLADVCTYCPELAQDKIQVFLDDLVRKKIMFREDDRYLALAVRVR